jgi:RNA polymerase sigma factor (sigma-70 family)
LPWQWHEDHAASEDVAEEVGRQTLVARALATLPPDYRAPLLLYAHHGFRIAEVAEALNLSEGAARMRLQRAREMFRKAYRREEEA